MNKSPPSPSPYEPRLGEAASDAGGSLLHSSVGVAARPALHIPLGRLQLRRNSRHLLLRHLQPLVFEALNY